MRTILIVGASLGGLSVAESLRLSGSDDHIVLLGDEDQLPYNRPPLSKEVLLGDALLERHLLKPRRWYRDNGVELALGRSAVALDAAARQVRTSTGETYHADEIVIATGARARALPGIELGEDVFSLRAWADATALGRRLERAGRMLIVGAGFIGLETAAAALRRGWAVTIVERDASPLWRVLPPLLAHSCWSPYAELGVRMICSTTVEQVARRDGRFRVQLDDRSQHETDVVVVAAGADPNTGWLAGSGVHADNGVSCDAVGRTSVAQVGAVGDAARWHNDWTGRSARAEHWQAAREQGEIVARSLCGLDPEGWAAPPYFWSDMVFGRVQLLGDCLPGMDAQLVAGGDRAIGLITAGDQLRGVLSVRFPRAIALAKPLLDEPTPFAHAVDWARGLLDLPARAVDAR
jgi:3-phenylpropionate/trans-cinnamate dioxygenase ferredoxin reductase component